MSIRLRLALQCAVIFCLALSLTSLLGYAFHVRGHYDDLDRILLENATHAASEAGDATTGLQCLSEANETGGIEIALRLYNAAGVSQEGLLSSESLPLIRQQTVLEKSSGPTFDPFAGLAPRLPRHLSPPRALSVD